MTVEKCERQLHLAISDLRDAEHSLMDTEHLLMVKAALRCCSVVHDGPISFREDQVPHPALAFAAELGGRYVFKSKGIYIVFHSRELNCWQLRTHPNS